MNKELIEKVNEIVSDNMWFDGDKEEMGLSEDGLSEIINLVQQSQWISVLNRLPTEGKGFLVFAEVLDILEGGSMFISTIAVYDEFKKGWLIDGIVTHWQPLPNPPPQAT